MYYNYIINYIIFYYYITHFNRKNSLQAFTFIGWWVPRTPPTLAAPSQSQSSGPALSTCTGGRYNGAHRFLCRLRAMFTARIQSAETLLYVATLHGWSHRTATVTNPSSDHNPCSLTCVISMAMPFLLFYVPYMHVLNIYKYSIYIRK